MFYNYRKIFWLLILFSYLGRLNGDDITSNPQYGCRWSGGSIENGVTCTCRQNAEEFFIEKGSIPSYDAQMLKIDGCNSVRFGRNAITDMRNLRRLELMNIDNLVFDEFSLSWNTYVQPNTEYHNSWDSVPTLKIKIERSIIKKISSYTFQGQISSIILRDLNIEEIAPFAFSSLIYTHNIEIISVNFMNIHAQAFKKFPMEVLTISDSTFNQVPSRTFSDVTVLDSFQIRNCSFSIIKSGAFLIHNCRRFDVIESQINILEGDSFKVTTRGSVKIKGNNFNVTHGGAFAGISLNKEEVFTDEEILFDSDTFNNLDKHSLRINTTSFTAKYINIVINQECKCDYVEGDNDHEEFQCMLSDAKKITLKEFKEDNCSILASYSTIIIILGVVLVLFIIIFSGLMFYFKRVYKNHKEYITDKNGKQVSLIMPDGRTYRETELHVVVERADLLTTDL
ncbi:hypothetical protein RN001_009245 [Aquatica leii]|uniref:Uncharacterized protein n=1 Tax=Aquatica leii TaxID=1421715 RepID=A0AAN7PTK0_9COLE|nr:hypothetical protein RN001_009245 [Aquatica leii]